MKKNGARGHGNEMIVERACGLLDYLYEAMPKRSRNSIKSILARGQVLINGVSMTQFDHPLQAGDKVVIQQKVVLKEDMPLGLSILYEDDDIIVIDKEAGLLSIADSQGQQLTAHRQLMNYVKIKDPKSRIYIVHRLDRETSGVMVFAKHEKAKTILQENWQESARERLYIGLVEGQVKQPEGTIQSWLKENKALIMYSSSRPNDGQKAITHYKVLQSSRDYSLMELRLETGRKNQIRVHMQDIGHPIVGDKKYGAKRDPLKRLALHAHALTIVHPSTKKPIRFESAVPKSFYRFER